MTKAMMATIRESRPIPRTRRTPATITMKVMIPKSLRTVHRRRSLQLRSQWKHPHLQKAAKVKSLLSLLSPQRPVRTTQPLSAVVPVAEPAAEQVSLRPKTVSLSKIRRPSTSIRTAI